MGYISMIYSSMKKKNYNVKKRTKVSKESIMDL